MSQSEGLGHSGVSRPRLLDLFCCQGGAAMGYHNAGFEVIGVDLEPQPRYPFDFILMDALSALTFDALVSDVDAIHASPPCQLYSDTQQLQGNEHPDLIGPVRELMIATGLPYVIENVEGARAELRDPVMLCGSMFGLRVYRHRLFEANFPLAAPYHPKHWLRQVKMGRPPAWDEIHQPVGNFSGAEEGREAMEMPWASRDGIREAIPPRYAEHVGGYLMAAINARQETAA